MTMSLLHSKAMRSIFSTVIAISLLIGSAGLGFHHHEPNEHGLGIGTPRAECALCDIALRVSQILVNLPEQALFALIASYETIAIQPSSIEGICKFSDALARAPPQTALL